MKKIYGSLLVMVLLGIASSLFAVEVLTHPEAQVEITVPDSWKQAPEGNVLKITAPDESMAVVFMVLSPSETDKALAEVDAELEKAIGEITWENEGNATDTEVNGMQGDLWNGTAKEGKFQVECIALNTPSGKTLGIYWFDTPESEVKYEKDIDTIVNGLKPVAGAATPAPDAAPAAGEGDTEETEEGAE